MKKILIYLTLIVLLSLSACNNSWQQDISHMDAGWIEYQEELLAEHLDILKDDPANISSQFETAYRYEQLGDYKSAEREYLKLIELFPDHLAVYNNLAFIYEQVGEGELAAEAIKKHYALFPGNKTAVTNAVRLLLKVGEVENAINALQNFITTVREDEEIEANYSEFTNDLFQTINDYKVEHPDWNQ